MQKLKRQSYITKNKGVRVNCYFVNISKSIVKQTNITENDVLKITACDNKIIIEKDS